jgi:hypothetical protein
MSRTLLSFSIFIIVVLASTIPAVAQPVQTAAGAEAAVRALLASRSSTLSVGTVREVGPRYEVEVVTAKGTLVDRLLIDKANGQARSLYGSMLASLQPAAVPSPPLFGTS